MLSNTTPVIDARPCCAATVAAGRTNATIRSERTAESRITITKHEFFPLRVCPPARLPAYPFTRLPVYPFTRHFVQITTTPHDVADTAFTGGNSGGAPASLGYTSMPATLATFSNELISSSTTLVELMCGVTLTRST